MKSYGFSYKVYQAEAAKNAEEQASVKMIQHQMNQKR